MTAIADGTREVPKFPRWWQKKLESEGFATVAGLMIGTLSFVAIYFCQSCDSFGNPHGNYPDPAQVAHSIEQESVDANPHNFRQCLASPTERSPQ